MKAVVYHGIGDIRVDDVPEPRLEQPTDAIIRITAAAICGTDLHFVRGTFPGMKPGTILGHEAVGVVEEVGPWVRNLQRGDRVVVPSTIGCGSCSYCRAGYYSQCDHANPGGPDAGTAFFGGPEDAGGFHGLQAEFARIPYAHVGLVKLPDAISDEQAIMLSDIFPTGWFGADNAEIRHGDTVAVFGCGPVGQFAIASALLRGAGRVLAVDQVHDRLEMARRQGAECIDFSAEDPVQAIRQLTRGIGPDRVIDAVGVDAQRAHSGPAAQEADRKSAETQQQVKKVAPDAHPHGDTWVPGDAPIQALEWGVKAIAKAGTLSIIGVYPQTVEFFPLGTAINKNITLKGGNCNHRRYIPELIERVTAGAIDPGRILTQLEPITNVVEAYEAFDRRESGWLKVEIAPQRAA